MTIIRSGSNSYAVHIPYSDPIISHSADDISIINSVLTELPGGIGSKAAVEIYPGKTDLLMFVNYTDTFYAMCFRTVEELLSTISQIQQTNSSELYFADGMYILLLKNFPEFPSSFPKVFAAGDKYLMHLSEHGKCIISENSVKFLSSTFAV